MIVRLGTAPRIDDLDFEGFQQHWRTSHADVVSRMPGLRRYQQFHAVLEGGEPVLPYPGFDACSALQFDTVEAMDAAFASAAFLESVQADEKEFVDKTRFRGGVGTGRPDVIAGLGGRDVIVGRAGRDLICAGGGPDRVYAGTAADRHFPDSLSNDRYIIP